MDSLIQQLSERFSEKVKSAQSGMYLIRNLIEKLTESEMFEYHQFNLPSEPSCSQEIRLRKQNWADEKNIPTPLSEISNILKI